LTRRRPAGAGHPRGDLRHPHVRASVRGLQLRRHPDGVRAQAVDHAGPGPV